MPAMGGQDAVFLPQGGDVAHSPTPPGGWTSASLRTHQPWREWVVHGLVEETVVAHRVRHAQAKSSPRFHRSVTPKVILVRCGSEVNGGTYRLLT